MTTRAQLRQLVRDELNDNAATKLWADGLLHQWLLEAIRRYEADFPKLATASVATVAAQADYTLPADCWQVVRVEHPAGFFRVPDPLSAGDSLDPLDTNPVAVATQLAYEVWGQHGARTLTLRPAPTATGETIGLRYLALYAEPAADGDVLATPSVDDQLLVWLVCDRALQWLGTDEAKRQRWERDRGVTAARAGGQYERDYRTAVRERRRRAAPRRLVVRQ